MYVISKAKILNFLIKEALKIKDIKTMVIKGNFEWILLGIYTDDGEFSLGEAFPGFGVREMIHIIGSRILGEDPTEINQVF